MDNWKKGLLFLNPYCTIHLNKRICCFTRLFRVNLTLLFYPSTTFPHSLCHLFIYWMFKEHLTIHFTPLLGGIPIEKSYYEVIKFLDHGDSSRVTMDVVKGELLANRVRAAPETTKNLVFSWFYQLLSQMIQYHRCYNNRSYRYLNPFSVVITEENEVLLLDIDAPSNHFVLKQLQTPSMREHFLKTTIQPTEENKVRYDIYCFGKTIQYVLASSESVISLNKREELKLLKLVEKCFEENSKKAYGSFLQMKKDLNFAKVKKELNVGKVKNELNVEKWENEERSINFKNRKLKIILMIALALIVVNVLLGFVLKFVVSEDNNGGAGGEFSSEGVAEESLNGVSNDGEEKLEEQLEEESAEDEKSVGAGNPRNNHEEEEVEFLVEEAAKENSGRLSEEEDSGRLIEDEDSLDGILRSLDEDMNRLLGYLHHNDKEANQKIISHGEEMELIILRGLAMAYDREGYHELAILAYGRLIGIEDREEHLERAILRKMKLEEELGLFEQAVETGRAGLELIEGSLDIGKLTLEVLINGGRASPEEVMMEYERLVELIPELEEDEIRERIESLE